MTDKPSAQELSGISPDDAYTIMNAARANCRVLADQPELWDEACRMVWDLALEHELIDEHQHERGVLTASGEAPDIHIALGWRTE